MQVEDLEVLAVPAYPSYPPFFKKFTDTISGIKISQIRRRHGDDGYTLIVKDPNEYAIERSRSAVSVYSSYPPCYKKFIRT